ncbi:hypothetical protein [Wolbachia endosymbiont of Drosophila tsacasi]|uniref:hypothetical protein n=1 Tax=Wolbachia endosymbiont of Drosophila tsacasi TaxID=3002579 RepID=UPI0023A9FD04|nr:hypothetical protein [Wolbachia endosymbiont of Drosophila tsacasi]MDE5062544.1 hypothetical protein [Wolbachia endosymbiont of Drosophila tsacasi]
MSSKWKTDFQKFEQSINTTHKELKSSLPGRNFLAYSTKDNDFKIRFENEEKPIEISNILRTSREGKVYNISLGEDSQITATKKGSERHYDFTGSSSCEMTINWQAKDSEGNSIDCSMTVKLDSGGIQSVIGKPKFGDLKFTPEETKDKILKLVEQNKEVFINGKTLYKAFTDMGQSVDNTQGPSSQLPILSSSAPSSRRSSLSSVSEFSDEDEIFEDDMSSDEEEYEQEELEDKVDKIINEIEELEEEKETFAKYFAAQAKQLEDLRLERNSLKSTLAELEESYKEKEDILQEELKSVKESLEQLQNILQQEKGQATQTEVEYESRGTSMQQQDQGIQAVKNNSSRIASGLRQENKNLTRDKLTISEQLKQKIREIDELKKNLKQLQEENKQLKQEVTKNAGVDASSSTGQKEAKEAEVIPQNIMDWPVPIPDDKPEEQEIPLEPIKVNTELSDPKLISAEVSEKSPPLSK